MVEYGRTRRAVEAVLEGRELRTRVDAGPARRHVLGLVEGGWSQRRVALTAGVAPSTLSALMSGRQVIALHVDVRLRGVGRP